MKLSAVIPCYNDEDVIPALADRVRSAFAGQSWEYELILVDDGSSDKTWRIIEELSGAQEHIIGIRLSRNHGHQLAITAGIAEASGDRVLTIDSDLQDPPELIPEMMKLMDEGADVVYGQRRSRQGVPSWKKFAYKSFYKLLSQVAGSDIPPDTGDFRLMSRSVAVQLTAMPEHHRFIRGMVSWLGYRQVALLYDRHARFAGESHYTLRKLFRFAFDGITSFSIQPLRVASFFALIMGSMALLGLLFIVFSWWTKHPIQGWTSLVVTVLFLGAMQLFVLGIIGEYLGRLFIESKRRPLYIIAELVGRRSTGDSIASEIAAARPTLPEQNHV